MRSITLYTTMIVVGMLCVFSTSSCEFQAQAKGAVTRIRGKVENFENIPNTVVLAIYNYDPKHLTEEPILLQAELDKNGEFAIETNKVKQPMWTVRLTIGYEVAIMSLAPGDDLFLTLDARMFDETMNFSGKGAARNNYMAKRFLKYQNRQKGVSFDHKYALPYEQYYEWRKEHKQEQQALLDSMNKVKKIDNSFYNYETEVIKWSLYNDLRIHQVRNHFDHFAEVQALLLQEMPFNDELFLNHNTFRDKLHNYVSFIAGENASAIDQFNVSREILTPAMRSYFDKNGLPRLNREEGTKEILAALEAEGADQKLIDELQNIYQHVNDLRDKYPDVAPKVVYYNENLAVDTFSIKGQIRNYTGELKIINLSDNAMGSNCNDSYKVSEDGSFEIKLPIYYSHDIFIGAGRAYSQLLANPGDEIFIEVENRDMYCYGSGAAINNRLNSYVRTTRYLTDKFQVDYRKASPTEILDSWQEGHETIMAFNEQFLLESDPEILKTWITKTTHFDYVSNMNQFPELLKRIEGSAARSDLQIPESYQKPEISLEPTDMIISEALYIVYSKMARHLVETPEVNDRLDAYKYDLNELEFDIALAVEMLRKVSEMSFEDAELLADRVKVEMNSQWMSEALLAQLDQKRKEFEGLVIPEGADLNVAAETSGDSLFQQIIRKHQGKTIYVDVWATWCGPCLAEFRFAEEFHDALNHDKVAMVYLAGKSQEGPWKVTIDKNKLNGDHYLLTDEQYADLAARFDMPGFPHYMIIDKNGIVKVKNAPRPSVRQTELNTELIEKLNAM